ncbi:MAG TPA: carbon-nitrogen hydrolase family protein [Candidatus Bathyarchaeia archaeon]|nr:carbon-nitrogen hydrolase family protein [Candidatus Bathyarchaeia archaeon]
MSDKITIALGQMSCHVGDKQRNMETMKKLIRKAKKNKADLIAFPELALTGYVVRDRAYELAEPVPNGPSVHEIEKIAAKEDIYLVFGMIERSAKARAVLHNSAVLVGPRGYIGKYQKMHLPTHSVFEEKRYFRPGYQASVFPTDAGNIGMIICYDIYFPEVTRLLSLKGANIIVCISASPSVRRGFFETLTAARAMENSVFLAFANLAGIEDGLQFWGGSRIIAPSGSLIARAKYDVDDMTTATIDYSDINRVQAWVPTLRDLRPEVFDQLREEAEKL